MLHRRADAVQELREGGTGSVQGSHAAGRREPTVSSKGGTAALIKRPDLQGATSLP